LAGLAGELRPQFSQLAQTEYDIGDVEAAKRAITKARQAYNGVLTHLPKTTLSEQERGGVMNQLGRADKLLRALET
jgi:hypothetical protein